MEILAKKGNLLVLQNQYNCKGRKIGPKGNRLFRQIHLLVQENQHNFKGWKTG